MREICTSGSVDQVLSAYRKTDKIASTDVGQARVSLITFDTMVAAGVSCCGPR
jgi:hypothetical protein